MDERRPSSDAPWWSGSPGVPTPRYDGCERSSLYVATRDGTKVAIDLFLPQGLPPGTRVPALLTQTPYLRAVEFRASWIESIASRIAFLGTSDFALACVRFGYAVVLMDLRGSGASYGVKKTTLMDDAARDGSDVLDWIVAQPWSNGRVGSTGVSAHGLCALWLTTAHNPALRAIVPRFTSFDVYASTHPGGVVPNRFMRDIGALLRAMDRNRLHEMPEGRIGKLLLRAMVKGIKPVDDDRNRRELAAAVRDHERNEPFDHDLSDVECRDDRLPLLPGKTADHQSVFRYAKEIEAAGVPIYSYAGWYDAGFVAEMISLHNTVRIPGNRLILGPWAHGAKFKSSPIAEGRQPSEFPQALEIVRFFEPHLRNGVASSAEPSVHYFTMGEERWKACDSWPPPARPTPFYLEEGNRLATAAGAAGKDAYAVDFEAGTGVHSRFGKHLTGELHPARYPDRRVRDQRLLVYDGEPLPGDLEVTGHPIARLFASSTARDGLFIVLLEDVDPTGEVRVVTDGWLRARHRKLAVEDAPYWMAGPYRSFERKDMEPLVPGVAVELRFELYPISWLYRAGHRVRVAIAGADKDNLQHVARDEAPVITLHRGGARASCVELPVVERRDPE